MKRCSFSKNFFPSYGATIPFWATYCRTKALFFWLTGDMAWLCAIKDSQQAAALYCALSRLGRSTLPDRSTKYCSSLLDRSFFHYVDQILPIIDHLPTLCWHWCTWENSFTAIIIDISTFTYLPHLVNVVKERPQNLCTPWTDQRLYKFSVSSCCEKNFGMQKFSESCLYFFFRFQNFAHRLWYLCFAVLALQQLLKQLDVRQRWQARVWRGFPFLRALHQKFIVLTH